MCASVGLEVGTLRVDLVAPLKVTPVDSPLLLVVRITALRDGGDRVGGDFSTTVNATELPAKGKK